MIVMESSLFIKECIVNSMDKHYISLIISHFIKDNCCENKQNANANVFHAYIRYQECIVINYQTLYTSVDRTTVNFLLINFN